ncbi:MAG: group II intron maturase-specific domain-containing protein [Pirellulaceae bacterium]
MTLQLPSNSPHNDQRRGYFILLSNAKERATIKRLVPRKPGHSLNTIIQRLNQNLRGWHAYFRHCHWSIFAEYDQMVRRRLRRILVKWHRHNRKRLPANQRWPNKYFHELGLYSLSQVHARFVQSTGTY